MICYVLAMGKQHLGPHVVVGYGIKIENFCKIENCNTDLYPEEGSIAETSVS